MEEQSVDRSGENAKKKKSKFKMVMITTVITGIFSIVSAVIAAYAGEQIGEQKVYKDLRNSVGEISGDNATVTINDVNGFVKDYENTKKSNDRYAKQLEDTTKELEELKKQVGDTPIFKFQDMGLSIDGKEISLDSKNAMVTVDGRRYLAEEFTENVLDSKKELTIKDNMAYVGKIVKDKTDLIGQWVMEESEMQFPDSVTDSYGNVYANAIEFPVSGAYGIFTLHQDYGLFSCDIAMEEGADINATGKITIKADNKVVYTSPKIEKRGEPFHISDIDIKNCSLLTIEYDVDVYDSGVILSNASVYN